jgi:hypothetical protein
MKAKRVEGMFKTNSSLSATLSWRSRRQFCGPDRSGHRSPWKNASYILYAETRDGDVSPLLDFPDARELDQVAAALREALYLEAPPPEPPTRGVRR